MSTVFVDPEVILLNALRCDEKNIGITYQDIRDYCTNIKEKLFIENPEISSISFQISKSSLENVVNTYPRLFRYFCGRYYRGVGYNPDIFDRRNTKEFKRILKKSLSSYSDEADCSPPPEGWELPSAVFCD